MLTRSVASAVRGAEKDRADDAERARITCGAALQRTALDPDAGAQSLWARGGTGCCTRGCVSGAIMEDGLIGKQLQEQHDEALAWKAEMHVNSHRNLFSPGNFDRLRKKNLRKGSRGGLAKKKPGGASSIGDLHRKFCKDVVRSYPADFCNNGIQLVLDCTTNLLYKPSSVHEGKCLLEVCGRRAGAEKGVMSAEDAAETINSAPWNTEQDAVLPKAIEKLRTNFQQATALNKVTGSATRSTLADGHILELAWDFTTSKDPSWRPAPWFKVVFGTSAQKIRDLRWLARHEMVPTAHVL